MREALRHGLDASFGAALPLQTNEFDFVVLQPSRQFLACRRFMAHIIRALLNF